jgi:riboflavin kinase/FMN adenylyltransferase
MLAYPTDEALLELTPTEFFHRIVIESLQARALVEGPNFFFGKNRQGGVQTLAVLCRDHGCVLEVVAPTEDEGTMISSSRIRQLLATGDCDQANTLLTEPYQLQGTVIPGAQRGRQLGFPTANLADVNTLIPAAGVYGGRTWIDGREWPAAINVGTNPTFGEDQTKLEVHVVGFSGQLYGKRLEVDFLTRLRDIQAFVGIDQLKQQLHRDIARAVAACTLAPQQ